MSGLEFREAALGIIASHTGDIASLAEKMAALRAAFDLGVES